MQRYRCKRKLGTFSLLPDSLLPYHWPSAGKILRILWELCVQHTGVAATARAVKLAVGTVRSLERRFFQTVRILRVPEHEGMLPSAQFLQSLARRSAQALADLFADWKELEPKHSIVGIYPR